MVTKKWHIFNLLLLFISPVVCLPDMVKLEGGQTLVIGPNLTCHLYCLLVVLMIWDLAMLPRLALDFRTLVSGSQVGGTTDTYTHRYILHWVFPLL